MPSRYAKPGGVATSETTAPEIRLRESSDLFRVGAVTEYRKALKMGDALASADRANHQAQRDRLVCLMNLSELLEKQGRMSEAADNARIAIETATRIAATDAESRLALKDLADAQERRGDVAMHSGGLEEAWKLHSAAAKTRERILHMRTLPEAIRDLCSSYLTLGSLARRLSTVANFSVNEEAKWQTRSKESIARARSMGEQIRKQTNLTVVDRETPERTRYGCRE
jgi:tetratricopeptide (TPR) repeat protein